MSAARAQMLEVEVEEVRVWEVLVEGALLRRASRVCVFVCVSVSLVGEGEVEVVVAL
jgi:hypothetical protein